MVVYNCNLCKYSTIYTTNYNKHCNSNKHIRNTRLLNNSGNMSSILNCQHNVNTTSTQSQHNVNTKSTQSQHQITTNLSPSSIKTYECGLCGMSFKTRQSRSRHEKKYCEILKLIDNKEKLKVEVETLQQSISNHTTNNTTNLTINYIKNDRVLNYLNVNFPNAIEMDSFINKMKNDTKLPIEMMNCFLTCYNNGGTDSFGSTLVKYLNQLCKQLDINIFPLCCTDSNLRSHKEKNSIGWKTVIDTNKIEEIIHHIVSDIFSETSCMINLNAKERKQICNIVKKSYGINTIVPLDNDFEDSNHCEVVIPI